MDVRPVVAGLVLAALLLATPTASAHTAAYSADGKVRASIGLLNEPVSTYAVTGLDVCFSQNTTTTPRPTVAANAASFTAMLTAPNGAVHEEDLEVPFGKPNCLSFAEPIILTQPGQYLIELTGSINGTTFAVAGVKAGSPVVDRGELTFPDAAVPTELALQSQITALQQRITTLEAAQDESNKDGEFAPGAPAALLLVGLAVFAALRRRAI